MELSNLDLLKGSLRSLVSQDLPGEIVDLEGRMDDHRLTTIREHFTVNTGARRTVLQRRRVCSIAGNFLNRKDEELINTRWSIDTSLGYGLGFRPEVISFDCDNDLTVTQLAGFGLHPIDDCVTKGWADGTFRINPESFIGADSMRKIMMATLGTANISLDRLLPIKSSWMFKSGGKDSFISFLIAKPGTPTFWDVFGWDPVVWCRAGQDFWKNALATVKMRLKVVHTADGHDDGNFWFKALEDFQHSMLVRAVFGVKVGDRTLPFLLKGRGIPTNNIDDLGYGVCPDNCHGFVPAHNIKWTDASKLPEFISVKLGVVTIEDFVPTEDRNLSLVSHEICDFIPGEKEISYDKYVKHANNVACVIKSFPKSLGSCISMLDKTDNEPFLKDRMFRLAVGTGSVKDAKDALKSLMNTTRTRKIKGMWLEIITRSDVPSGSALVSFETLELMASKHLTRGEGTLTRFPITSKQSFLTVKVKAVHWLPTNMIVINTSDAKGMGADGDDHGLFSKPFSNYRGGDAPITLRDSVEKIPMPKEVDWNFVTDTYAVPSISQKLIANAFNGLIKARATGNKDLFERVGASMDLLAQAIKKPFNIDDNFLSFIKETDAIDKSSLPGLSSLAIRSFLNYKKDNQWLPGGFKKLEIDTPKAKDMIADVADTGTYCSEFAHNIMSSMAESNFSYDVVRDNITKMHNHIVTIIEDDSLLIEALKDYALVAITTKKILASLHKDDWKLKDDQMSLFVGVLVTTGVGFIHEDPLPCN